MNTRGRNRRSYRALERRLVAKSPPLLHSISPSPQGYSGSLLHSNTPAPQGFCPSLPPFRAAFTLMELLVVIAIIGLLAGMILYLGPAVSDVRKRKLVQVQMQELETVINSYKETKGFYPPDNPKNTEATGYYMTSLYYELTASGWPIGLPGTSLFGVGGVVNWSGTSSDAKNFHLHIKDRQFKEIDAGTARARILGVNLAGPLKAPFNDFSPWHYRVAPTTPDATIHNANSYDLWITINLSKGPKTFGNWKESE